MNSEFFYVAPTLYGPDPYKLLVLPIIVILLFERFVTGKLSLGWFGGWVISFLGIALFGVIVGYFYGQSLALGIKAAKFVPFMLAYFLVAGRPIDADKFSRYFVAMALGVGAIATIQYFLPPDTFILTGMSEKMKLAKLENPRLTIGQFVVPVAAVMAFAQYKRNFSAFFLIAAVLLLLECIFIQQTRVIIAGIFLSLVVVYLLSTKLTILRVSFFLILAGIFLGTFLVVRADVSNLAPIKETRLDIEKRRGSYQARVNAYTHYWQEIGKKLVFGRGLLNFNWQGNKDKYLQHQKGVHLSDIGIFQFFVQAGLLGFLWFIYGFFKLWGKIFRYRDYVSIASYFILGTFTMPTIDMFLRFDSMFLFAVFLGIFSTVTWVNKSPTTVQET